MKKKFGLFFRKIISFLAYILNQLIELYFSQYVFSSID